MLGRFFTDLKKYRGYLVRSVKADLKSEVANSYLNWIWWVLEPLCFGVIYYVVFGCIFSAREQYFGAFILLGLAVWKFFAATVKSSIRIMKRYKNVATRVYVPKHVFILNEMGVNGFKGIISFAIAIIAMIVLRVPITWRVVMVIPLVGLLLLIVFNVSCFLMHFGVYVADLSNIVNIFLRIMLYFTGVFYNVAKRFGSLLGENGAAIAEIVNPVAYVMSGIRKVMLYSTMPDWRVLLAWYAVAIILCILAINLVYKNENSYVKSI